MLLSVRHMQRQSTIQRSALSGNWKKPKMLVFPEPQNLYHRELYTCRSLLIELSKEAIDITAHTLQAVTAAFVQCTSCKNIEMLIKLLIPSCKIFSHLYHYCS